MLHSKQTRRLPLSRWVSVAGCSFQWRSAWVPPLGVAVALCFRPGVRQTSCRFSFSSVALRGAEIQHDKWIFPFLLLKWSIKIQWSKWNRTNNLSDIIKHMCTIYTNVYSLYNQSCRFFLFLTLKGVPLKYQQRSKTISSSANFIGLFKDRKIVSKVQILQNIYIYFWTLWLAL